MRTTESLKERQETYNVFFFERGEEYGPYIVKADSRQLALRIASTLFGGEYVTRNPNAYPPRYEQVRLVPMRTAS
ncbi:MAG: hypothetical protein HGA39_08450 [Coriobacteriia bacterium]|nr:hypothetical protein [Coriobacteriia bacterium]